MPGYKVHLTGAAVLGGGTLFALHHFQYFQPSPMLAAALLATCLLASLFPDIDTSSKGRGIFYILLAGLDVVLIVNREYQWAALVGLVAMLPALGNHRGWTHTWWAMLAVPMVVLAVPYGLFQATWQSLVPFLAAAVLGYFSHLALDRKF